jgi:hypothetical protein
VSVVHGSTSQDQKRVLLSRSEDRGGRGFDESIFKSAIDEEADNSGSRDGECEGLTILVLLWPFFCFLAFISHVSDYAGIFERIALSALYSLPQMR